jgi:hypothetical protein
LWNIQVRLIVNIDGANNDRFEIVTFLYNTRIDFGIRFLGEITIFWGNYINQKKPDVIVIIQSIGQEGER